MQAILRGWVQAILAYPASIKYWGTWVDLPQPVSPATTTIWWVICRNNIDVKNNNNNNVFNAID